MKRVRITVLKTTLDQELAAEYGVEGLTACPMLKAGQVFYADYAKPEGLCDEANPVRYKSQITLAKRRIQAFTIADDLIARELGAGAAQATQANKEKRV